MIRVASVLERTVVFCGRLAAWAGVALVLVTMADVITREFTQSSWETLRKFSEWQQAAFGSTRLQELEWHLHTILFLPCLGWAYVTGAHVRIDIFRERCSARTKAWIEIVGILLFLLPFTALVVWFGIDFAASSLAQHESSASAGGLGNRWIIKAVLPAGLLLLMLAGIARLLTSAAQLAGSAKDSRARDR